MDRETVTEQCLRRDCQALGIEPGMTLMVHSSLSAIGWVLDGANTVVRSLLGALGGSDLIGEKGRICEADRPSGEGTLVMPAATPQCGDPSTWSDVSVPESRLQELRDQLPVFDPLFTSTSLGAIPEAFRSWSGTLRSLHPLESVCAHGPSAKKIVQDHPLAFSEGLGGPFDKLYQLEAWVLLLGVGFNRCTALHFAESLVSNRRTMKVSFPTLEGGVRRWVEVQNVADDNDTHFPVVGELYLAKRRVRVGNIGGAKAMLFPMIELVDFAKAYFARNLPPAGSLESAQ